jgi:hypothetical protein
VKWENGNNGYQKWKLLLVLGWIWLSHKFSHKTRECKVLADWNLNGLYLGGKRAGTSQIQLTWVIRILQWDQSKWRKNVKRTSFESNLQSFSLIWVQLKEEEEFNPDLKQSWEPPSLPLKKRHYCCTSVSSLVLYCIPLHEMLTLRKEWHFCINNMQGCFS